MSGWFPIMAQSWDAKSTKKIVFMDGFSGEGTFKDGSFGSPLLALHAVIDHTSLDKFKCPVELIFVEKDESTIGALKKNLKKVENSMTDIQRRKGKVIHMDMIHENRVTSITVEFVT
jgi:three-Cys-motif partner protein